MDFSYRVIRTNRKRTASIQVSPSNEVTVIVPKELPEDKLNSLVKRKTPWILKKLKFNQEVRYPHKPKEFVSGEAFQYLGRNYRLKVMAGDKDSVELKGGRLNVMYLPENGIPGEEQLKKMVVDWYMKNAERKLKERTVRLAKRIGVDFRRLKVKDLKRQWGSCSRKGDLVFNWKIIIAPIAIVDYVVAHELCHRKHHDHSKSFWNLLESVMPDYREKKEWLRIHGAMLGI